VGIERIVRVLLALALFLATSAARAEANEDAEEDDDAFGAGAEADARTRFVWRGVAWSRGPVVQPSAWASASGLSVEGWSSVSLGPEGGAPIVAGTVARDIEWRSVRVTPAIAAYHAPRDGPLGSTAETELEVAIDVGAWSLATSHALDVGARPFAYLGTLGIEHTIERGRFTLTIVANAAWANARLASAYFHAMSNGPAFVEAGIALRYDVTRVLYVALHAEGTELVSTALRREAEPALGAAGVSVGAEL
jgi:hypothetical protein